MKLERSAAPSLHYEIDDFTDPWKDAPHVILQHGHGRSGRFWYGWVPYLSRFYKVVRPDLRGLGQSSADFDIATQSRLDAYIEDLVAIIGALGAKSVHFCGESMGGQLGLALAALHPRLVRTLTIVATPVLMTKKMEDDYSLGRESRFDAMQTLGRDAWIDATNRSTRFPPGTDEGLLDWYKKEFAKNKPEMQAAMSRAMYAADVAQFLPRIEAPVLALYPRGGPRTGPEQEEILRRDVRRLSLVHVPSAFHKIQLTHTAACAQHLLHFMAQHDGRACTEA
jgi:3-oxoadipate enol-lactonase